MSASEMKEGEVDEEQPGDAGGAESAPEAPQEITSSGGLRLPPAGGGEGR